MNRLIFIVCFICSMSIYAQDFENILKVEPYTFEDFNQEYNYLLLETEIHQPSLSNIRETVPTAVQQIQLQEFDLHGDLRKEAFRDKTPLVMVQSKKKNLKEYTVRFTQKKKPKGFSVNVTSGNNSALYGNRRSGKVTNQVYQESRGGFINPFTGTYYQ